MASQLIRLLGDPVLRTMATEVTTFDRSLRRLVRDLEDTMDDANGAGLAAPQIGVSLRVFTYVVADPDDPEEHLFRHLVNPVLTELSAEEVEDDEACLSIPGLTYPLRRHLHVVARGFDMYGEPLEVVGTARLARCIQHETDHLDGVLFLDRLDPELRERALMEFAELNDGELPVVKRSPH